MAAPGLPQPLTPPQNAWFDVVEQVRGKFVARPLKEIALYFIQLDTLIRPLLARAPQIENDLGTPGAGATTQIDSANGLKQKLTNTGAQTIQAPTTVGDVELRIVNGAGAGLITFAGFAKQFAGDALDTTNGHQFAVFIYGWGATAAYLIRALQ